MNSEKRWKSTGPPGALALVGLKQSLDVFNDSFTHSMSANANATSRKYEAEANTVNTRNTAVALVQRQEAHLTNDQAVVLMDLFQSSTAHSTTYLNIEKEDLRRAWLAAQLARAGRRA